LIEDHPKDVLPEFLEVLKEDLEKAKTISEMPQEAYQDQIEKYKILKELYNKYMETEYV
jgi:hypothetical protein